ncbi:S-layer homology domain-containing protein [Paraclostridium ghonii]|uniref:S-layer homology domain-containing protein n=1 Tax=Paraclostridium ghonii TaxID=29358 RepID=UPI00202D0DAA|nr:S-layer homology domain-containing protein [Paeniclostridium ghonii]MCM0165928.1 S-layer homology domain-containing protein [Paeniclostridium ghonii]
MSNKKLFFIALVGIIFNFGIFTSNATERASASSEDFYKDLTINLGERTTLKLDGKTKYIINIPISQTGLIDLKVATNAETNLFVSPPGAFVGFDKTLNGYENDSANWRFNPYINRGDFKIEVSSVQSGECVITPNFNGVPNNELEPNDSTKTAQKIQLNELINGFFGYGDIYTDIFRIDINEKDRYRFNINNKTDSLMTFDLYNNDGDIMYQSVYSQKNNTFFSDLNPGIYFVKVHGMETGCYDLSVESDYHELYDTRNHWAKSYIDQFTKKGYITGYEDGTFRPDNPITRAEFVKIFNKQFNLTSTSGKIFNDTKYHWAKNDIDIAVTNGVCNGMTATEFEPDKPITREQAAKMVANYKKLSDSNHDKINGYNDFYNVSNWAKNSVEGVIEAGYMSGYPEDNTFRPKNNITRAEAVVTLSRVN